MLEFQVLAGASHPLTPGIQVLSLLQTFIEEPDHFLGVLIRM
jgi:hypothetical protein